jgi:hypothetical protein
VPEHGPVARSSVSRLTGQPERLRRQQRRGGAGPDVVNAFRAVSLKVADNAGVPPVQAHLHGSDAKTVAIGITREPNHLFATRPGSGIRTVGDFNRSGPSASPCVS